MEESDVAMRNARTRDTMMERGRIIEEQRSSDRDQALRKELLAHIRLFERLQQNWVAFDASAKLPGAGEE